MRFVKAADAAAGAATVDVGCVISSSDAGAPVRKRLNELSELPKESLRPANIPGLKLDRLNKELLSAILASGEPRG